MSKKVFVGGLSWNTTDIGLQQAFEVFGPVTEARVIKDRDSGRSRGFGFVTFSDGEDADRAIEELNQTDLDGRTIRVNEAQERESRHRGSQRNRGNHSYRNRNDDYGSRQGGYHQNDSSDSQANRSNRGNRGYENSRYDNAGRNQYRNSNRDRYGNQDQDRYGNQRKGRRRNQGGEEYGYQDRKNHDQGGGRYDRQDSNWRGYDDSRGHYKKNSDNSDDEY